MPAWLAPAVAAVGMALGAGKDKRQLKQQGRLNEQQMEYDQKMLEIQNGMAIDMWKKTGAVGQMEQLQKAGLNAGLMYGGSGVGGQSMGTGSASVNGAKAPAGSGREIEDSIGMGMQLALLKAQKENIEADTANKRSGVPVNETQANLNTANEQGKGLENALKAYLQGTTPEGKEADNSGNSIAVQQEKARLRKEEAEGTFKLDENQRQELMNSAELKVIANEIILQGKEGKKLDEIIENLKREGKLLDIEIRFSDWGFSKGDVGAFVRGLGDNLIKKYLGGGRGGKK